MSILITGASGFVGARAHRQLRRAGIYSTIGTSRSPTPDSGLLKSPALESDADWKPLLDGTVTVTHCAARVHVMADQAANPLQAYRRANTDGTLTLARQAAEAGVRRFVFLSSIKVLGEKTATGARFHADTQPRPQDPYAVSKLEAEKGLRAIAAQTGMEVVIIRPPLVYGPGVKANFLSMMRWLHRGLPLPLAAVRNHRSLVALDNLVDLIVTCIDHPAAANQTFLVSDGEDLSTPDLLRRMGRALGKPARLFAVPQGVLEAGASLLGRRATLERLCGSLQVDISATRQTLGWTPPVTLDAALEQTARWFLEHEAR